ncbi:MAG: hypothetical protein KGJ79_13115 [Alphaproteobacteria bacterium]|nr:hypothetical protein [Alphaproteobacteria bacterium]MDE2112078.1 hypothetical protein [Alphaproteobacteria bacterium]MDE2492462.1 hypothetical protein [Alphaproteobacteria bacterium]
MAQRRLDSTRKRKSFSISALGGIAAVVVLAVTAPGLAGSLSSADQQCLACHGTAGLEKPLPNGETLSLHIDGDTFAKSVHSVIGCASCHSDIDLNKHPTPNNSIASKRSFSIVRAKVCSACHSEEHKQWSHSVHAALVRDGNPVAPLCTSCHSPHAVIKGVAEAMDTVPCKTCHGAIFTAYAGSVHGALRSAGVTHAPLCFSCHGAHDVTVPTANRGMKDVCLGCHTDAVAAHQKWLPNTLLHFDVVSCPACHAPKAQRTVDLVLYNSTTHKDAARPVGVPEFENTAGSGATSPSGLDPVTLFNLLRALNRPGIANKTSIKGRLDVRTGVEAHELAPSNKAISDCSTCHRAGAQAFQSVTISVAGPGGIPIHYGVDKDVLSSVFSINSIGGFYAIGGTRITFLDVLLILGLLVGFGGPLLHLILRWTYRRHQSGSDHEQGKR